MYIKIVCSTCLKGQDKNVNTMGTKKSFLKGFQLPKITPELRVRF